MIKYREWMQGSLRGATGEVEGKSRGHQGKKTGPDGGGGGATVLNEVKGQMG